MKELPKGLIQRLLKSEGSSSSYSNGLWFMPQENKLIWELPIGFIQGIIGHKHIRLAKMYARF